MLILGALLILGGVLAFVLMTWSQGRREMVAVAVRDIAVGEVVEAADIRYEPIGSEGGLNMLPQSRAEGLFTGQTGSEVVVSSRSIRVGTILAVTDLVGQDDAAQTSLVGVVLEPGAYPTFELVDGQEVDIVAVASSSEGQARKVSRALIHDIEPIGSEQFFITLRVPHTATVNVVNLASNGRIRLTVPEPGAG